MNSLKQKQVLVQRKIQLHCYTIGHIRTLKKVEVQLEQPEDLLVVMWEELHSFVKGHCKGLEGAESDRERVVGASAEQAVWKLANV